MTDQSYKGFDRKKGNFQDLTLFSRWIGSIFWVLDAMIILIHEIKTGSYG